MLHELVFLGCHSQFALYPYTFASYSYSCKILQPYVAVTVRMHSNAVLCFTGALLIKTVIKIIVNNKWSTFVLAGIGCRIHVNQPLQHPANHDSDNSEIVRCLTSFSHTGENYNMFHVAWTIFSFSRIHLGTVSHYITWLWLITLLMCTLKW